MKKTVKVLCYLSLAALVSVAAAPNAGASSYYAFLQQHFSQSVTQPVQPTTSINNFWTSRTAARSAWLVAPQPAPAPAPAPAPVPAPGPSQLSAREQAMLNLINRDRTDAGLRPLQADMRLTRLARIKSQDIVDNKYFAHTSPTLGSPYDMMRAEGIRYTRAGENLSKAGSVGVSHARLMNSPSHRANLMNPHFTHIGIGIVNNVPSGIVVTQMFIQAP